VWGFLADGEDWDNTLRRNVGTHLLDYKVSEAKSWAKLFNDLPYPYKRILEYITSLFIILILKCAKNDPKLSRVDRIQDASVDVLDHKSCLYPASNIDTKVLLSLTSSSVSHLYSTIFTNPQIGFSS
jgi:hypothetical protein